MSVLIAECGATKSRWTVVRDPGASGVSGGDGCVSGVNPTTAPTVITLPGVNLSTMRAEDVEAVVRQAALELAAFSAHGTATAGADACANGTAGACVTEIDHAVLYLAGVLDAPRREMMQEAVRRYFPSAGQVSLEGDLLAAARAACGHSRGIAAILGTGANSCLFDGTQIRAHINTGGFILGDEGGASALGRMFVSDHIKGLVPQEIDSAFCERFDGSYEAVVAAVYGKTTTSPSAYLGSIAPLLVERYDHPYVKALVDGNFRAFFERCLCRYGVCDVPLGIVGGFGYACRDIITPLAREYGFEDPCFIADPLPQLIEYHKI